MGEVRRHTVPVSACRICDEDRATESIPEQPCGHDFDQVEIRGVETVELAPLLAKLNALADEWEERADAARELCDKAIKAADGIGWSVHGEAALCYGAASRELRSLLVNLDPKGETDG